MIMLVSFGANAKCDWSTLKLQQWNERNYYKWYVSGRVLDDTCVDWMFMVYDFQTKKRIRYHEIVNQITPISELAQIFTLNKNLFVQIENDVKMFGNKNLNDSQRLFDILKNDLLKKKKTNFLFVKDITTHQRTMLYDLLESKGFNRRELFRHYSY